MAKKSCPDFLMSLPSRQRDFIMHLKTDAKGNATKAAILAGYSEKCARFQASRLLSDENIRQHVKAWEEAEIAKMCPQDKKSYVEATFERASSVAHPPTAAKYWELGGRALGYFDDEKKDTANALNVLINELHLTINGQSPASLPSNTLNIEPSEPPTPSPESAS